MTGRTDETRSMSAPLVLSCAQVRELDRRAIEEHGVPSLLLMENAGRASADEAQRMLGSEGGSVLVLAGPGNNGGDGFVVARTLFNRGVSVRLLCVASAERLARASEDVQVNVRLWRALGQELVFRPDGIEGDRELVRESALVVDALLGTGTARQLVEPMLGTVRAIGAHARRVLAVDLPTGLDADRGEPLGAVVEAEATVTFVAAKPGFQLGVGPRVTGRVVVAEIGIPRPLLDALSQG